MITIGHDAEVFLKTRSKGVFKSGEGIVGGTKENPHKINYGALQEDNVMAELNIDPATDRDMFSNNTKMVMDQLRAIIKPHNLVIHKGSDAEFLPEDLQSDQAKMFGCLPDYDAWDICENPIVDLSGGNTRFAGGHIHIGVDYYDDPMALCRLVRRLDCTLGVGMVAMFGKSPRHETYGKWGAHRPTAYGVEYRVPDNSWLFKPAHRRWVFDVVEAVAHPARINHEPEYTRDTLIKCSSSQKDMKSIYNDSGPVALPEV